MQKYPKYLVMKTVRIPAQNTQRIPEVMHGNGPHLWATLTCTIDGIGVIMSNILANC